MRKAKPNNRWDKMRSDIVRRLTTETSKEVSLTADSNVSQNNKPKLAQRDASRMQTPEARAKRLLSLKKNREKRQRQKEACREYRERYGLVVISLSVPSELRDLFNAKCQSTGVRCGDKLRELITEYVTRPDKS